MLIYSVRTKSSTALILASSCHLPLMLDFQLLFLGEIPQAEGVVELAQTGLPSYMTRLPSFWITRMTSFLGAVLECQMASSPWVLHIDLSATRDFSMKAPHARGWGASLLNDQVSICLHSDTLHVISLLFGVLPFWVAVLVHDNFAVLLHSKLVDAVLTPQAVSREQPLIVTECVVGARHIE